MRHDEPLDLAALHSEVPLRDSDYAAIRARVRAEIARREQRRFLPLFIRFAFAAMLVALIAVLVVPRKRGGAAGFSPPLRAGGLKPAASLSKVVEPKLLPEPAPVRVEKVAAARPKRRVPRRSTKPVPVAESMRIEMQTADPDVRIIWIVQPEAPRENS